MPEEVGVRPLDGGHQIFVGNRSLDITDSQLLILSRLIPTYLRRVVSGRLPKARGDLSPIAPIPVTDIRLNEDALGTQVHLTIDDVAGGSLPANWPNAWLQGQNRSKLLPKISNAIEHI
jgi:hypothetical protein